MKKIYLVTRGAIIAGAYEDLTEAIAHKNKLNERLSQAPYVVKEQPFIAKQLQPDTSMHEMD